MEKILKVLKELHVSEYRLIEKKIYSKEWFFIKKKLDMSRAKEITDYYLTIYQPVYLQQERFKGQASAKISPNEDEDHLIEVIQNLMKEASFIKNPYFELPLPSEPLDTKGSPLGDIQEIIQMMNDFYESEELSLNSYELFETFEETRIINSKGIDVTYFKPSHELEIVINAKNIDHEIEIYQDLRFGQANVADLKHRIGDACRQASDRKQAISTSKIEVPSKIIISKENVLPLMKYYLMQLNTNSIYRKYSTTTLNSRLGPTGFKLDGLDYLENSSRNQAYDEDGRIIKSVSLIEDGIVKKLWGAHVSSYYLNQEDTTQVYNFKIGSGSMTIHEMHEEPYLELVQFSSFNCDMFTGDFAGEIRLGYYYDGKDVIAVTGGSISGNIKENEATMKLSKELAQYDYAVVPQAVLFNHVSISV